MLRSVLLVVVAVLSFAPLASHAQYGRWDYDRAWTEQAERQDQGERRRYPREAGRGDDRRGGLSPEERRELDRDLQRADREFYRKGKDRRRR